MLLLRMKKLRKSTLLLSSILTISLASGSVFAQVARDAKYAIIPTAFYDGSIGRKIINVGGSHSQHQQQQQQQKKGQGQDDHAYNPSMLRASEVGDRFKVIDSTTNILGIGLAENLYMIPYIGLNALLPMVGTEAYSERYAASEEGADALPRMRIPASAEDLDTWSVGDLLQYNVKGAITWFPGLQAASPLGGVLMPVAIEGEWGVTINKLSESELLLGVERKKEFSVRGIVGNIIGSASVNAVHDMKKLYAFVIDMKDADAREAFPNFIRGDLVVLQKQMMDGKSWIKEMPAVKAFSTKKSLKFRAGIPYMATITKEYGHRDMQSGLMGQDANYHEKSDEVCTDSSCIKIFKGKFKHVHKGTKVVVRKFEPVDVDGCATEDLGSDIEMTWEYTNDGAKTKSLDKAMKRLYRFTGMSDRLRKYWEGDPSLGYFGVQFQVMTNSMRIKDLAKAEQFRDTNLLLRAQEIMEHYFDDLHDPSNLCTKSHLVKHCHKRFKHKTEDALLKLSAAAEKLASKTMSLDDEMSLLIDIGHYIFETPFTIQTMLEMSDAFDLSYKIEGQKFQPVDLTRADLY